jgi:hypothetical protein
MYADAAQPSGVEQQLKPLANEQIVFDQEDVSRCAEGYRQCRRYHRWAPV